MVWGVAGVGVWYVVNFVGRFDRGPSVFVFWGWVGLGIASGCCLALALPQFKCTECLYAVYAGGLVPALLTFKPAQVFRQIKR